MLSVLVSYLKFHYSSAYREGYRMLKGHGSAMLFVGIPLAVVWTILPFVVLAFFLGGIYLTFIWNSF